MERENFQLNDGQLELLGVIKLDPKSWVYSTEFPRPSLSQWAYKNEILSFEETRQGKQWLIFDKSDPEYSIRIESERNLKAILRLLDKGKTIVGLLQEEQDRRHQEVNRMLELQKNPPYLEDYSTKNIGGSYFILTSKPDHKVFMLYEHHSTLAFRYTFNDLTKLENATDIVFTGTESHTAISLWFLTLESYINALVKLCCLKKNEDFKQYKNQSLSGRLNSLIRLLKLDIKEFNQHKIFGKLDEFTQFRNELFHDRHFGDEIKFKHTAFSPIPLFNSQVDVVQSLKIVVEIASLLRFAITGLDTMPTAILHTHAVVWEHLDVVYRKIIQPHLEAILAKHKMRTRLNLELPPVANFSSDTFSKGETTCYLQTDQDPEFEFWLNRTQTSIGKTLYTEHMNSLNFPPDTLRMTKVILT